MPPRQIKRPRVSLSCIVCRRRKVRCGREHPECANCVRMKEHCVYKVSLENDEDPDCEKESTTASATSAPICSDHLSLRRGARSRYISPAFWGFVAGREFLSDDFFDDNHNHSQGLPPSHISSVGMFGLLQSLPTKAVSDALLAIFGCVVWPLAPLVHLPTLRADYDAWWDWCRHSDKALPPAMVRNDPTFICLLFAILYCGACAAPVASWMEAGLRDLQKETTVTQLKSAYETSLSLCQHLEHPTLNTLVSTLLTGPWLTRPREPMHELVSVSTTVRLAQSMGLHREPSSWSPLSPVDREMRRRAWWYIVRLDVQSSIATGLPPCCGSEALDAVYMLADTRDEELGNTTLSVASSPEPVVSKQSIALIFAIMCSETARLQSKTVARLQSGTLTPNELQELLTAMKNFQQKLDTLIARIPSPGIPERGLIPSRLANASPSTNPLLYQDDATQPSVLAAWARIMLTLQKFDVAILLRRPFLPPPDGSNLESRKAWTSIAQLCVSYLRILLHVYETFAFAPYLWFYRSYQGPLQCVFLTLIYLHSFKDSGEISLARYYLDEIIEHTISHYNVVPASFTLASSPVSDYEPPKAQVPHAIQVLVDLHRHLDAPADHLHSHSYRSPTMSGPLSTTTGSKGGPFISGVGIDSYSRLDPAFAGAVADLDAWASSLIRDHEF